MAFQGSRAGLLGDLAAARLLTALSDWPDNRLRLRDIRSDRSQSSGWRAAPPWTQGSRHPTWNTLLDMAPLSEAPVLHSNSGHMLRRWCDNWTGMSPPSEWLATSVIRPGSTRPTDAGVMVWRRFSSKTWSSAPWPINKCEPYWLWLYYPREHELGTFGCPFLRR